MENVVTILTLLTLTTAATINFPNSSLTPAPQHVSTRCGAFFVPVASGVHKADERSPLRSRFEQSRNGCRKYTAAVPALSALRKCPPQPRGSPRGTIGRFGFYSVACAPCLSFSMNASSFSTASSSGMFFSMHCFPL